MKHPVARTHLVVVVGLGGECERIYVEKVHKESTSQEWRSSENLLGPKVLYRIFPSHLLAVDQPRPFLCTTN